MADRVTPQELRDALAAMQALFARCHAQADPTEDDWRKLNEAQVRHTTLSQRFLEEAMAIGPGDLALAAERYRVAFDVLGMAERHLVRAEHRLREAEAAERAARDSLFDHICGRRKPARLEPGSVVWVEAGGAAPLVGGVNGP